MVLETETPHNMETIKPFEVKIVENNPTKPQIWRVFIDREFTASARAPRPNPASTPNTSSDFTYPFGLFAAFWKKKEDGAEEA